MLLRWLNDGHAGGALILAGAGVWALALGYAATRRERLAGPRMGALAALDLGLLGASSLYGRWPDQATTGSS